MNTHSTYRITEEIEEGEEEEKKKKTTTTKITIRTVSEKRRIDR